MRSETLFTNSQAAAAQLGRGRVRSVAVILLMYVFTQIEFATKLADPDWATDISRTTAWLVYSSILVFLLMKGSAVLVGRQEVGQMLDDEITKDNRSRAITAGFWAVLAIAAGLFSYSAVADLAVRSATHLLLTTGLAVASARFGWLEWRAYAT